MTKSTLANPSFLFLIHLVIDFIKFILINLFNEKSQCFVLLEKEFILRLNFNAIKSYSFNYWLIPDLPKVAFCYLFDYVMKILVINQTTLEGKVVLADFILEVWTERKGWTMRGSVG